MVKLRELLKDSPGHCFRFERIIGMVTNVSGRVNTPFPTYTNHDVTHLKYVEEYADRIIPNEIKSELNIHEVFFLLCGIWLHDMGMIFKDNELELYNSKLGDERDTFVVNIRESHNIRSETFIKENKEKLGLNWHEAEIIGKIAKGHRKIDLHDVVDDDYEGSNIRISFLSAILRLADECHVDKTRESALSKIGIDKKTIHDFYNSHEKIDYVRFDFEEGNILISCELKNRDDLNLINKVKSKIQDELNGISDILEVYGVNLTNVELDHHSDILIEKEMVLHLAKGNFNFDEFKIEDLSNFEITDRLNKLLSESTIIEKESGFELNYSLDTFEKIFKNFEDNGDLDIFYFTQYSCDMIPEILKKFNDKFGAIYLENHQSRLAILKNSPTAARLAFNFDKFLEFPNFDINSNQNGELILDYLLLMSIFNDVKYYNGKIKFKEVEPAITKLNWSNDDILSRIHQYKDFDKNEFKIGKNNDDVDRPISFSLKLKSDTDDILNILDSAFKSGNPAKFVGDRIIEFNVTENGETKKYSPDAIMFSPSNILFDLKLGSCWYNDVEFKRQVIDDNNIKFTSVSDKLDVNISFTISDEDNQKLNLKIWSKSQEIKDMFYFYLFSHQHASGDFKIYFDNKLFFEETFPENDITDDFIEKYRKLNRINDKLNLNLVHPEDYIITENDFNNVDMIESRITNNSVTTFSISKPINSVSELEEILDDEGKQILIKLNSYVELLGQEIDLGVGVANINSLLIENKEEILNLIESYDSNQEVKVSLKVKDNNSEEIIIKFDGI